MKPIHLITTGSFGEEISKQFIKRHQDTKVTALNENFHILPSDQFPSARLHVFAAWRPSACISKQLDRLFFQWKEPWLPIIMEHPYLRIGPLIIPGKGPCFHCFHARLLQHSPVPEYLKKIDDHYAKHPEAGPKGYLRSFAGWSAAFVSIVLKSMEDGESLAGSMWQTNVLTRDSFRSNTIGVHGCPRCGLKRSEKSRSVDKLFESLQPLLGERREGRL
ncbi:TOMM precursor leader peptide-binding protein [Bacillus velezensis]|uniref:TOMM precursor leader peptide-binding protein n=1 Tax=Bacillus velezensis TaxID=492670 RepID=UPI0009AC319B|nr:TOMM precursor leader peptide-binding protein [Bacillus velezensis]AWK96227.1 hypothetical protein A2I97_19625 [Bacillus velezensis]NRR26422.1 TOMM precursor leader peptide-binding protein [Bacillus velezensis]WFO87327.1 TOMM precursor leader peptide-binding protein [Bacillus velezensis]